MNGTTTVRGVRAMLAATAGACLVTLISLWPMATEADDTTAAIMEENGISPNSARAGSIEATSHIVPSSSKWYFEVRFVNRSSDGPETAEFTEQILDGAVRSEMSRVAPMPRAIWQTTDHVALGPGEATVVRHELPAGVAARWTTQATRRLAASKANRPAPKGKSVTALASATFVRTSLWGRLEPPRPAGDRAQSDHEETLVRVDPFDNHRVMDVPIEPAPAAPPLTANMVKAVVQEPLLPSQGTQQASLHGARPVVLDITEAPQAQPPSSPPPHSQSWHKPSPMKQAVPKAVPKRAGSDSKGHGPDLRTDFHALPEVARRVNRS